MTHIIDSIDSTSKVRKEHDSVKTIRCENLEELHQLLNSL